MIADLLPGGWLFGLAPSGCEFLPAPNPFFKPIVQVAGCKPGQRATSLGFILDARP